MKTTNETNKVSALEAIRALSAGYKGCNRSECISAIINAANGHTMHFTDLLCFNGGDTKTNELRLAVCVRKALELVS